jgi:hypothetical protein
VFDFTAWFDESTMTTLVIYDFAAVYITLAKLCKEPRCPPPFCGLKCPAGMDDSGNFAGFDLGAQKKCLRWDDFCSREATVEDRGASFGAEMLPVEPDPGNAGVGRYFLFPVAF